MTRRVSEVTELQRARTRLTENQGRARRRAENPEKYREKDREWYRCNPEKRKYQTLKRLYGLSFEQHQDLFIAQGCKCAVCGATEPGRKSGTWATDHLHGTKQVRGILCHGCNVAIGMVKESSSRLRLLADYLESRRG